MTNIQRIPARDELAFRHFVDQAPWRTASSAAYQKFPHQYAVRDRCPDKSQFYTAVRLIRSFGVPEKFYKRTFIYLHLDEWKYWTMNEPLEKVELINRAHRGTTYGEQDAPLASTAEPSIYDYLAPVYDQRYLTPDCLTENQRVAGMLGNLMSQTVLDIGCGTGLLLEITKVSPRNYLGIDPAQGMINEFLRKHPYFPVAAERFADLTDQRRRDLAVALFGAASYLTVDELQHIPKLASSWLLMFYRPGYLPSYYDEVPPGWHESQTERLNIASSLGTSQVEEMTNYVIIRGDHGLEG